MRWKKPDNFHDLVSTVFQIWKYTGLPIIQLNSNRKFIYKNAIISFFLVITIYIVTYLIVQFHLLRDIQIDFKKIVGLVMFVLQVLENMTIVLIVYAKRHRILNLIDQLQETEGYIKRLLNEQINYKRITNKIIVFLLFNYSALLSAFVFDCLMEGSDVLSNFLQYGTSIVQFHVHFLLFVSARILIEFYQIFATNLAVSTTLTNQQLLSIYSQLKQLSTSLIRAFEAFILVKCCSDLLMCSGSSYYTIVSYRYSKICTYMAAFSVVLTSHIFLYDFLLVSDFATILDQDSSIIKLITNIFSNPNCTSNRYKEVELFQLNVRLNPVRFRVYGMFAVDKSLFYSMIAATVTYTIYLLQFKQIVEN